MTPTIGLRESTRPARPSTAAALPILIQVPRLVGTPSGPADDATAPAAQRTWRGHATFAAAKRPRRRLRREFRAAIRVAAAAAVLASAGWGVWSGGGLSPRSARAAALIPAPAATYAAAIAVAAPAAVPGPGPEVDPIAPASLQNYILPVDGSEEPADAGA